MALVRVSLIQMDSFDWDRKVNCANQMYSEKKKMMEIVKKAEKLIELVDNKNKNKNKNKKVN